MGNLHCLDVGCGDASVINNDGATMLVDCHNIEDYVEHLPSGKRLCAVFITHQHEDHYSGLEYLKDNGYQMDYLIYSPYKRRLGDSSVEYNDWRVFESYVDHFDRNGAICYTPYRQSDSSEPWRRLHGIDFWIIGPSEDIATADDRELHDACLVIKADMGDRICLFTGDASDKSLNWIAKNTKNFCNDILHASHHGSENGADLDFIKKCDAKFTLVSTEEGVYKSVPDSTAMRRYRTHTKYTVHRTDKSGTNRYDF